VSTKHATYDKVAKTERGDQDLSLFSTRCANNELLKKRFEGLQLAQKQRLRDKSTEELQYHSSNMPLIPPSVRGGALSSEMQQ
jgi:hypothetical protein